MDDVRDDSSRLARLSLFLRSVSTSRRVPGAQPWMNDTNETNLTLDVRLNYNMIVVPGIELGR